jgi:hypothetical protein
MTSGYSAPAIVRVKDVPPKAAGIIEVKTFSCAKGTYGASNFILHQCLAKSNRHTANMTTRKGSLENGAS